MHVRSLTSFALALFALGASAPSAQAQAEVAAPLVRSGKFAQVHYDGADAALADSALAVVDQVWPLVAAAFGVPDAKPAKPLEIHLYREIAGYEAAEAQLTGGRLKRNLAMAHHASRSAHVALQPPCTDVTLQAIGLPAQTLLLLAWETTHVARFELCPNFESHPDWLVDGLASNVAQRVTCKAWGIEPAQAPFWAAHARDARALAVEGKLPSVADLLGDKLDALDWRVRYGLREQWFGFLWSSSRQTKLAQCLSVARQLGGGSGYAEQLLQHATQAFESRSGEFTKHLTKLQPQWDEVFRSLAPRGKDWVQIAFPTSNAIAWNLAPVAGSKLSAKGKLHILPGGRGQLNFLFGRTDAGFYSIAFVADYGFTVLAYDSQADSWTRVHDAAAPNLKLNTPTPFEVVASGEELRVRLAEQSWDVKLPRKLANPVTWGLGAQAGPEGSATGSAGLWLELVVGK
jgi:hypothetical protein